MVLVYGGVDLSGYITKYGMTESLRIIEGQNKGTSINGTTIADVVSVKIDPSFTCRPLTPTQVSSVWGLVSASVSNPFRELRYTGADGSTRAIQASISVSGANKVMETTSKALYDGITIRFKEK